MSISRLEALPATSAVIPALAMLVVMFFGASTLKVSWVSLPSAPVGVMEVRAVEFTAMSVKMKISGMAMIPCQISTPKKRWAR